MPSLLKQYLHVEAAKNFVDKYASNAPTNHIYLTLGASTAWPNEIYPPTPADLLTENQQTWNNMFGAKKMFNSTGSADDNLTFVVPRVDWVVGGVYRVRGNKNVDQDITNSYVLNSQQYVYLCISSNGTTTSNEPTGTGSYINTGDGYVWKFLYDISAVNYANMLSTYWMPVNYGTSISSGQTANGDVDAINTLSSQWVMFRAKILSNDLPINHTYRRVSLLLDPQVSAVGNALATGNFYQNPPGDFLQYSGQTLYVENRSAITRVGGQTEEIKIVLKF